MDLRLGPGPGPWTWPNLQKSPLCGWDAQAQDIRDLPKVSGAKLELEWSLSASSFAVISRTLCTLICMPLKHTFMPSTQRPQNKGQHALKAMWFRIPATLSGKSWAVSPGVDTVMHPYQLGHHSSTQTNQEFTSITFCLFFFLPYRNYTQQQKQVAKYHLTSFLQSPAIMMSFSALCIHSH